jgi:hypothetical protein
MSIQKGTISKPLSKASPYKYVEDFSQQPCYQREFALPYYLIVNKVPPGALSKSLKEFMAFLEISPAIEKIYLNGMLSHTQGLHKQSVFYAEKLFCLASQHTKTAALEMALYFWAFVSP